MTKKTARPVRRQTLRLTEQELAVARVIGKQSFNTIEDFSSAGSSSRESMLSALAGFQKASKGNLEQLIPLVPPVYDVADQLAYSARMVGYALRCPRDAEMGEVVLMCGECFAIGTDFLSYAERMRDLVAHEVVWWCDECATSFLVAFAEVMDAATGMIEFRINWLFPERRKHRVLDVRRLVAWGRNLPPARELYEVQARLELERVKFQRAHDLPIRGSNRPVRMLTPYTSRAARLVWEQVRDAKRPMTYDDFERMGRSTIATGLRELEAGGFVHRIPGGGVLPLEKGTEAGPHDLPPEGSE